MRHFGFVTFMRRKWLLNFSSRFEVHLLGMIQTFRIVDVPERKWLLCFGSRFEVLRPGMIQSGLDESFSVDRHRQQQTTMNRDNCGQPQTSIDICRQVQTSIDRGGHAKNLTRYEKPWTIKMESKNVPCGGPSRSTNIGKFCLAAAFGLGICNTSQKCARTEGQSDR